MTDNIMTRDMFADGATRIPLYDEPNYKAWIHRLPDGNLVIEEEYPALDGLFDANKSDANAFNANGSHGDMVKVASIPHWLVRRWEEETRGDPIAMRRKLNDPDNAKFRTNNWRL